MDEFSVSDKQAGLFRPRSRRTLNQIHGRLLMGPRSPLQRNETRGYHMNLRGISRHQMRVAIAIHHRNPVPPQRWHFTTLSPFFRRPLPSQFLHFCFFLMFGPLSLAMIDNLQGMGSLARRGSEGRCALVYTRFGP
jgi:hypothetical protein